MLCQVYSVLASHSPTLSATNSIWTAALIVPLVAALPTPPPLAPPLAALPLAPLLPPPPVPPPLF